jgi:KUP system potassium uptake protein
MIPGSDQAEPAGDDGDPDGNIDSSVSAEPLISRRFLELSFLTLGVIYGDIGTSPLYTYSTIFTSPPSEIDVIGVTSLMIWSLIIISLVKYTWLVFSAISHGEGGTVALYSLSRIGSKFPVSMLTLCLIAISAILSDGILTPAISVLGAIQGITILAPDVSQDVVIWVSAAILVILYAIQYLGTRKISILFSPIMLLWFISLVGIQAGNLATNPTMFKCFSPHYGFEYLVRNGRSGWASLGGVFLTITGSEAMYADLGHFSAGSIRVAYGVFVLPCLITCYLGQASALINDPTIYTNVFYLSLSSDVRPYALVIATCAATIASQAMISASYSLISQATRLGIFPRLKVLHTDKLIFGRVFVPSITVFNMVVTVLIVVAYRNAVALGYAYGIAVSLTFLITTVLMIIYQSHVGLWYKASIIIFGLVYIPLESVFLSANLLKVPEGGWFTLMMISVYLLFLAAWNLGESRRKANRVLSTSISESRAMRQGVNMILGYTTSDLLDNLACFETYFPEDRNRVMMLKMSENPVAQCDLSCTVKTLTIGVVEVDLTVGFNQAIPTVSQILACISRVDHTVDGLQLDEVEVFDFARRVVVDPKNAWILRRLLSLYSALIAVTESGHPVAASHDRVVHLSKLVVV